MFALIRTHIGRFDDLVLLHMSLGGNWVADNA